LPTDGHGATYGLDEFASEGDAPLTEILMEYRQLGRSGLKVPAFSLGTATFGGTNEFFQRWGQTGVEEATRMIDLSLDNGLNFFDTSDVY
jgi:diketogulonate reductase-like aldo/keto reductase